MFFYLSTLSIIARQKNQELCRNNSDKSWVIPGLGQVKSNLLLPGGLSIKESFQIGLQHARVFSTLLQLSNFFLFYWKTQLVTVKLEHASCNFSYYVSIMVHNGV